MCQEAVVGIVYDNLYIHDAPWKMINSQIYFNIPLFAWMQYVILAGGMMDHDISQPTSGEAC